MPAPRNATENRLVGSITKPRSSGNARLTSKNTACMSKSDVILSVREEGGFAVTVGPGFAELTAHEPVRTRRSDSVLDRSRDRAIVRAVLKVLAEVGYRGLTMDEVALVAGVSKATIYRRWSSKVELLVSVLLVARDSAAVTDTGSLRGDLLAFMSMVADLLHGPTGKATRAVIGQIAEEPALAEAYRAGPLTWWDEAIGEILERAQLRGEVAPHTVDSVPLQAGPAIFLQLWYLRGRPLDEATVTAVVDDVMIPLLTRKRP